MSKMGSRTSALFWGSTDITDMFQDCESLVEFLISFGHLPPPLTTITTTSYLQALFSRLFTRWRPVATVSSDT